MRRDHLPPNDSNIDPGLRAIMRAIERPDVRVVPNHISAVIAALAAFNFEAS